MATSTSTRTSRGCPSSIPREGPPDMPKSTATSTTFATSKLDRPTDHAWDAIVIGGGHNGLTNAAYLAKAGLRTLVLERRHLVGGAAITEELRPGYWFTTFSYALSLLRPDIIHELELTKHGFMPILMPTTFCPMENGDYLLLGQDHGENHREIARHSKHDADAYDAFNHDVLKVCQAIKPLLDAAPPDIFSDDPEELVALAMLGQRFRRLDKKVLHDAVRLLTGSAADFLDDYFESDILKGYLASSSIIGTKVGPYSQGSGLVLLYHLMGEHDGEFGAWAFHKRGNGGFTQLLARAAESFGVEIRLRSPVETVITRPRPSGRPPSSRPSPASASRAPRPRSTSPSTAIPATRRSATGRTSTAASPTSGPRWNTSSGPSTKPSTAPSASRPTSTAPSSRRSTRTWPRRARR